MNIKLIGIVGFLLTNFVSIASVEESVAQKIARKSRENRIAENMPMFHYICQQVDNRQVPMDYETIRHYACFGECESKKICFRAIHAGLPKEWDVLALKKARTEVESIPFKK